MDVLTIASAPLRIRRVRMIGRGDVRSVSRRNDRRPAPLLYRESFIGRKLRITVDQVAVVPAVQKIDAEIELQGFDGEWGEANRLSVADIREARGVEKAGAYRGSKPAPPEG